MRSRIAAFLLFPAALVPRAARAGEPPKLEVIVSVDGLSWDRLREWRPWYRYGLARLMDEGRVMTNARYAHLNTETGPGHASLGTGAPPRVTGIVTNMWFEPGPDGKLREFYCTDQAPPEAPAPSAVPGAAAPKPKPIPGPANLRVPTFADRLVETHPASRVVSLSGKDRGAIFLAGHLPSHAVFWFDWKRGAFVTSGAYDTSAGTGKAVAEIVRRFTESARGALPLRFGRFWQELPVDDPVAAARLPRPASHIEMFQIPRLGLSFDHHEYDEDPDGYFAGIWHSPAIDEMLADVAVDVLDDQALALGRGPGTDLLCLSFSAQDLVAHYYGNESEEDLDVLRRLDVQLGRVLDALDRRVGKGRVLVAFSADHGFSPIPELRKKRGEPAGRLVFGKDAVIPYLGRINRRLDEVLCLDPKAWPVAQAEGFDLYYAPGTFPTVAGPCGPAGRTVGHADVDAQLPAVMHELFAEEVAETLLVSRRDAWSATGAAAFARNDFDAKRSGDAVVVPKPGVILHWDGARGSTHGSQYDESTHVPLIFWGAGVSAGTVPADAAPYDLAPTLASQVGVTLPDATGKALPLR